MFQNIFNKIVYSYQGCSGSDFASVGMFDFQIDKDANLITEILNALPDRTRP